MTMTFNLLGVNHRTAPVEVRERLAIPESRLPEATRKLVEFPGVVECVILSTCNRVELLARGSGSGAQADLRGFIHEYFQIDPIPLQPHLYEYRERDAIRHIFRVASSLDSMVVGEPQILGQVKESYAAARSVGALNSHLDVLLRRAFTVAKKVRTETAIGASSVSIASVAVDLARKIFGSLQGKTVFLVGAGKMSELAARHLMTNGAGSIFVSNRTYERAVALAAKFSGEAVRFDDLYSTVDRADIVITSTGSPTAIFRKEHGEQFLHRRKNRPMFFIDIAVPRDVDAAVNTLDGMFVYDIDDLQSVLQSHVADRRREADRAEALVEEEVKRFEERLKTLDVTPTIVSLQETLETLRQAEIDRFRGRLGKLSPEQEAAVDLLTQGIVNKILHAPIRHLKTEAKDSEATTVIETIRRLFNLSDGDNS